MHGLGRNVVIGYSKGAEGCARMVRDCTYAGAGMGYGAMPGPECWTLILVVAYAHAGLAKR